MSTTDLWLGQAQIKSTSSPLQLRLESRAQIAASGEQDLAVLRRKLLSSPPKSQHDVRPWVHRGSSLRLIIDLHVEPDSLCESADSLVESLCSRLKTAQFWTQLCLSPVSIEHASPSNKLHHEITVFLAHSDADSDQPKRRVHKLLADVPAHDMQPPPGVETVRVSSVRLSMQLDKRRSKKRRRTQPHASVGIQHANDVIMPPSPLFEGLDTAEPEFNQDSGVARINSLVPSDRLLQLDKELFEPDVSEMLLDGFTGNNPLPRNPRTPLSSSLKHTSPLSPPNQPLTTTSPEETLTLIAAALRTALSNHPKRTNKGLTITENDSLQPLTDFAPSLFSPGHLTAISSRAVFLPTIAHALNGVCFQHAAGPGLREKSQQLARRLDSTTPRVSSTVEARLSVHLHRLLQARLYDPKAARRLKALGTPTIDVTEGGELLDELLDAPEAHVGATAATFRDDKQHYDGFSEDEELVSGDEGDGLDAELFEDTPNYGLKQGGGEVCSLPRNKDEGGGLFGLNGDETVDREEQNWMEDELLSVCESVDSIAWPDERQGK